MTGQRDVRGRDVSRRIATSREATRRDATGRDGTLYHPQASVTQGKYRGGPKAQRNSTRAGSGHVASHWYVLYVSDISA